MTKNKSYTAVNNKEVLGHSSKGAIANLFPGENLISGAGVSTETRHNMAMDCNMLTVDQVCSLLKISHSTLYDLLNKKELVAFKQKRRTVFRPQDVEAYINSLNYYGEI